MENIRRKIGDNFSEPQLSKGVVVIEHSRPQGLTPRQPRTTFLLLPAEFVLQALIGYCKGFDIRIPANRPKRLIAGDLHISIQYEYSQSSLELED